MAHIGGCREYVMVQDLRSRVQRYDISPAMRVLRWFTGIRITNN